MSSSCKKGDAQGHNAGALNRRPTSSIVMVLLY